MSKIITHPGSAHKDDFMAVSVLLATLGDAVVYRREPTRADLDDPATWVVDVGMEYTHERHNFDHHQDKSLPCAFHLVMQHLGHHEAAMQMFVWYPQMSMMDVRGPYKTAEHLGIDASVIFASSSPIDGYILSHFSQRKELRSGDLIYQFMKALGRDLLQLIQRKMKRLERLKQEARVVPVKHYKAIVCEIEDEPKLAMELYLRHLGNERAVLSITPSVRGPGWELLRLDDHAAVDFLRIANEPDIRFVHANGFLAKTNEGVSLKQAIRLAAKSITN